MEEPVVVRGEIRSFAIEPDHPLIPHWEALRREIEAALEASTIVWSALEVLRRRSTVEPTDKDKDDTTIIITAQ